MSKQDVQVCDVWNYCDIEFYIVTRIYGNKVDLLDIKNGEEYKNYSISHFKATFRENQKLWTLVSRQKADLVE